MKAMLKYLVFFGMTLTSMRGEATQLYECEFLGFVKSEPSADFDAEVEVLKFEFAVEKLYIKNNKDCEFILDLIGNGEKVINVEVNNFTHYVSEGQVLKIKSNVLEYECNGGWCYSGGFDILCNKNK